MIYPQILHDKKMSVKVTYKMKGEMIIMVKQNYSLKYIAEIFKVCEKTVKYNTNTEFRKKDREQAAARIRKYYLDENWRKNACKQRVKNQIRRRKEDKEIVKYHQSYFKMYYSNHKGRYSNDS